MIYQDMYIILAIILVICLANYAVDYYYYLKNRYCRFHIGRYENLEDWHKKVEKRAAKWLTKTPTVKITDNSRYMLLDFVTGKYRSHTIQSWQKAALILGLLTSSNDNYRRQAKETSQMLLDENGHWRRKPVSVDYGMLSYAVLKATDDPDKVKSAMDESLSVIMKNINDEGMVSYTGGRENPDMYVDTIGLVCPFLMLY